MILDFLFKPNVEKLKAKRDVKGLIKALHYKKDYKVRRRAAESLGEIGDAKAVKSLMGALKDKDVCEEAIRALRRIGDVRAVKSLLNETEWISYLITIEKWDEVVKIGKPAVKPLIDTLKDTYWNVRVRAAEALGEIGDPRAVKPLIFALKDKDRDVHEEAIKALKRIGDVRVVKPLLNETEWISYLITIEKWDELVKIGKPAVKPLIGVLKNEDTDVQVHVAEALGMIGDTRAVKPLIIALKDENTDVRVRACVAEALGKIGDALAVEPLITALKDRYWNVRVCAVKALGEIGDTRAVKPLMDALKDENTDVHKEAEKAILRIHEPAVKSVIDAIKR